VLSNSNPNNRLRMCVSRKRSMLTITSTNPASTNRTNATRKIAMAGTAPATSANSSKSAKTMSPLALVPHQQAAPSSPASATFGDSQDSTCVQDLSARTRPGT
jgi:hypothetical protein